MGADARSFAHGPLSDLASGSEGETVPQPEPSFVRSQRRISTEERQSLRRVRPVTDKRSEGPGEAHADAPDGRLARVSLVYGHGVRRRRGVPL